MTPPRFIPATVTMPLPTDAYQFMHWDGLPVSGLITSGFGGNEQVRIDQGWGAHNAVDIWYDGICGTPIRAVYPGTVHFAFGDGVEGTDEGSLGTFVILKHEGGGMVWYTLYAHLLTLPIVKLGASVAQGDILGLVGYSGAVSPPGPSGAHLHFAVMEGVGYANRELDTFFDPVTLAGAALLPPPPIPVVIGDKIPDLSPVQLSEIQYVFGGKVVAIPGVYELSDRDYTVDKGVISNVLELLPQGTPVREYRIIATTQGARQ